MVKVLIVDDEVDLTELMKMIFEEAGYEVECAQSGYEAIEKTQKTSYDLYLLDIKLPDINGVEVFLKIKEMRPHARVIMMTGFAVENLIKQAIENGAYTCIHKPFDMERLLKIAEEILKSKKKLVLIADSIKNVRQELKAFLENKNYAVYEAENGTDVLAYIKKRIYDIILLDYELSNMDGLEVFREVKKIDQTAVVILMLNEQIDALIKDALLAGFYGCIEKPINGDQLLTMLKEATKARSEIL